MSSTWSARPSTDEWNTSINWEPERVPRDAATFAASSVTVITFAKDESAEVKSIDFVENAPSFNFEFGTAPTTPALTIAGKGVANGSGRPQSFTVASVGVSYQDPQLKFTHEATAGGEDVQYAAGPESPQSYGGGIISFCDQSTAGAASFTVRTGSKTPPKEGSTVGGEVSFCDAASADRARFVIYGSLGADGDTFGNAVFHDRSTAADGVFTNIGGTVSGGDGGNTQFYDEATAARGAFENRGGTVEKANGGDVAFDGSSNGGEGVFHNRPATVEGAYGGVTSFNNNPPEVEGQGASAAQGRYYNYGASGSAVGGGGHTEFSAKHGSPTAANGTFFNYGSVLEESSSAGHTILSVNLPSAYSPTAAEGTFWNLPGTQENAAGGYTEFSVYGEGAGEAPTAGEATFHNIGASANYASGGSTTFAGSAKAGRATLIATGGSRGGYGGRIVFQDDSEGQAATVKLFGNGELDLGDHRGGVSLETLEASGGRLSIQLGTQVTGLVLASRLRLQGQLTFSFWQDGGSGFEFNTPYTVLTAPHLSELDVEQFSANSLDGVEPTFFIEGDELRVSYDKD